MKATRDCKWNKMMSWLKQQREKVVAERAPYARMCVWCNTFPWSWNVGMLKEGRVEGVSASAQDNR